LKKHFVPRSSGRNSGSVVWWRFTEDSLS